MILGGLDEIYPMVMLDLPVEASTCYFLWREPLEVHFWQWFRNASHSFLAK